MKFFLLVVSTFFTLSTLAQINYEKGYIINNSNDTTFCYIRNVDWKNNPTNINYKHSLVGEALSASIENLKEFSIYNHSTYKRFKVNIDRSSSSVSSMSLHRNPDFIEETLLLKLLVKGNANLYFYEDGNLKRFFFNIDTLQVEPLIFKKYITTSNRVSENNTYKFQLTSLLKCPSINHKEIDKVNYYTKDLTSIFEKYNNCVNGQRTKSNEKSSNKITNISIIFGGAYAKAELNSSWSAYWRDVKFNNLFAPRLGFDIEFNLPFNNNKWSVVLEPTFSVFKSEKDYTYFSTEEIANINYKQIELPIGIRHKFFLTNKSYIYVNGQYVFSLALNSSLSYNELATSNLKIKPKNYFAFGIGYSKNKYGIQLRYNTIHNILKGPSYFTTDFKYYSLELKYKLFD